MSPVSLYFLANLLQLTFRKTFDFRRRQITGRIYVLRGRLGVRRANDGGDDDLDEEEDEEEEAADHGTNDQHQSRTGRRNEICKFKYPLPHSVS